MQALLRLLDQLRANMERVADSVDVEPVHDLRVSVRRATEALRRCCPQAVKLRKEIKAIREKAAAVRDRDVTRQILRRLRLPSSDPAMIYLSAQRDFAAADLQLFLRKQLRKQRPDRWKHLVQEAS
jgi:CHAD domain-containing protein